MTNYVDDDLFFAYGYTYKPHLMPKTKRSRVPKLSRRRSRVPKRSRRKLSRRRSRVPKRSRRMLSRRRSRVPKLSRRRSRVPKLSRRMRSRVPKRSRQSSGRVRGGNKIFGTNLVYKPIGFGYRSRNVGNMFGEAPTDPWIRQSYFTFPPPM